MIKYLLCCHIEHEFEGWFQSMAAFDAQASAGQLVCPRCGSDRVSKAVMAPNVATRDDACAQAVGHKRAEELLRRLRAEIEVKADDVGPRFAEEARRMHFDEAEQRRSAARRPATR